MKSQTESLEHASVRQYCKAVRVPVIGANFLSLAQQAVKENRSHIRYLEALLAMECEERDRHAISKRIRDAQLPRMKTLEEFDFAQAPQISAARIRELAEGGYVLMLTIFDAIVAPQLYASAAQQEPDNQDQENQAPNPTAYVGPAVVIPSASRPVESEESG
jgi:crotonobetainyl-CoA:carnitine CoA-transferase CaiB-like acyl-CoA transferase